MKIWNRRGLADKSYNKTDYKTAAGSECKSSDKSNNLTVVKVDNISMDAKEDNGHCFVRYG
jgi:hypothetical protein